MDLTVKRVQPGRYQFGTKQIMVTLINESLLIRVGGGYMKPDQFIKKYGPIEMHKLRKQREIGGADNRSGYSGSGSRRARLSMTSVMKRTPSSARQAAASRPTVKRKVSGITMSR